jgi:hypothetical protein
VKKKDILIENGIVFTWAVLMMYVFLMHSHLFIFIFIPLLFPWHGTWEGTLIFMWCTLCNDTLRAKYCTTHTLIHRAHLYVSAIIIPLPLCTTFYGKYSLTLIWWGFCSSDTYCWLLCYLLEREHLNWKQTPDITTYTRRLRSNPFWSNVMQ